MKRCPKCNCGAEFTNSVQFYAAHSGGAALGVAAGMAVSIFHPNGGGHTAKTVYENVTKNVKKHYKCTNSNCGHEWDAE